MRTFLAEHPKTRVSLTALGALVLLIVLFALFFDWNLFRPTLARIISEKTGRHTVIRGNLRVHLWSFEPSAEVDGLTMDNPPWAQRPVMFAADELTVSVSLGRLLRGQLVVPQIKVVRPVIDLERDAKGRASWELGTQEGKPQKSTQPAKIPMRPRLTSRSRARRSPCIAWPTRCPPAGARRAFIRRKNCVPERESKVLRFSPTAMQRP